MYFTVADHNKAKNPSDFIHYKDLEFSDIPEMVMAGYAYSACKFVDNYRLDDNYDGHEDVLILDIDDGATVQNAKDIFNKYEYFIITTKSHQKEKNGIVCDRYRIFLKLETTIHDANLREVFVNNIMSTYPFVDTSCRNRSRFYFSSPDNAEVIYNNGIPIKVSCFKMPSMNVEDKTDVNLPSGISDDIFCFNELTERWENKNGFQLEQSSGENGVESKLKGAETVLDNEFHAGNRNHTIFKVACMLLKDGLNQDDVANYLIKENDKRDGIKMNELMACIKSAIRTI